MNLIIKIFRILFIIILFIKPLSANITEDLLKLSDMYNKGILTSEEFTKAKSILLQIEEIESSEKSKSNELSKDQKKKPKIVKKEVNKKKKLTDNVKIERMFTTTGSKFTNKSFEKMKLTVGDFIIYTHRPGAIKIKKITNNKQYAVIGDNLDVKFYNKGQDFLDINVDKENKELILKINNSKILVWKGQYVQKAEATFYQILALGRLPFHFYIKLDIANNAIALNMEKFNRSIELAVNEKKKDLSSQYNITIAQIDEIIEQNDMLAAYGEIIPTNNTYTATDQNKLLLYSDLKNTIGKENFITLNKNIDINLNKSINKAIDTQIKVAIDDSIRDAIQDGISRAALEAGLQALLDALASGASWAEAWAAGSDACGC